MAISSYSNDRAFNQHVVTIAPENGLIRIGTTDAASGTFQVTSSSNYRRLIRVTTSIAIRLLGGTGASVDATNATTVLYPGQEYRYFAIAGRESMGYKSMATPASTDYVSFGYISNKLI